MKHAIRFCHLLAALFVAIQPLKADPQSTDVLERLAAQVRSMGGYAVEFAVEAGGRRTEGDYLVRGDDYSMRFGRAEVFCDGTTRWEVDPDKREVVIDLVDTSSRNILNNPTRAFDLLDGAFTHEIVSTTPTGWVVRLVPATSQAGIATVELAIDRATSLPRTLTYLLDDERVLVTIRSFRAEQALPRTFRAADYPDYEMIDFR